MHPFLSPLLIVLVSSLTAFGQFDTTFFKDLPSDAELRRQGMPTRGDMRRTMRELKGAKTQLDSGFATMFDNLGDSLHFDNGELEEDLPRTLEEKIARPSGVRALIINLRAHPIERLPEGFDHLTDLELLVIANLPEGAHFDFEDAFNAIGRISSVRDLYVINNGNGLRAIPASVGQLTSLERLTCYRNALTTVPDELRSLESLEELSIEHNKVTALPPVIAGLKSLKHLGLEENAIAASECVALQRTLPDCVITYSGGR